MVWIGPDSRLSIIRHAFYFCSRKSFYFAVVQCFCNFIANFIFFPFFSDDSFNCFVSCLLFFITAIISRVIFISTIILTWVVTGFWLTQSDMVATLSFIYLNIICTVDLRFTIIYPFIMAFMALLWLSLNYYGFYFPGNLYLQALSEKPILLVHFFRWNLFSKYLIFKKIKLFF